MGMDVELRIARHLCWAQVFKVNGVKASDLDFGEKYDRDEDEDDGLGCNDMRFTRIPPTPEVLLKYRITEDEYAAIAAQLEEGLSFGSCGLCE